MARFAVIRNGAVATITEASPDFAASQGWIAAGNAQIGWVLVAGQLQPPDPNSLPVPRAVTMRQARLQLIEDELLDDIEAALNAITNPKQREKAKAEWEHSREVQRTHPLVNAVLAGLGYTSAQVDELFRRASVL